MNVALDHALDRFAPVGLDELNAESAMLHRKDRKYLVRSDDLTDLIGKLPAETRRLAVDVGQWSRYESTYFDTPDLDLFVLAARRRPARCKTRIRRYLDSGLAVAEVKTKDRRGRTVKHRLRLTEAEPPHEVLRALAASTPESAAYADRLRPMLTTRYRRSTLQLPGGAGRATIDGDSIAVGIGERRTGIGQLLIVETKTGGRPSVFDRLLWRAGHRPVTYSKYCTAMAALDPLLPANRWHPVLGCHAAPRLPEGVR